MLEFEPIDLDLDPSTDAPRRATSLTLLALGPTPQRVWAVLASACGLELHIVDSAATLEGLVDTVVVIDGTGAEDALAATLLEVVWGECDILAVGTVPADSLELIAVRAGVARYFALPEQFDALHGWIAERSPVERSRRADAA